MADQTDYRVYHTATLPETELNFRNALRCLRIVRELVPFDDIVDFGCGLGAWMAAASWLGARRVTGIDGPWVKDFIDADKGIAYNQGTVTVSQGSILEIDLAEDEIPNLHKSYGLAISIEVAEHLPQERANIFCQALVYASDYIVFAAATPGQGGYGHINEQPLGYWIAKFWQHHYLPLEVIRPRVGEDAWMYPWTRRNTVMFVSYAALLRNKSLLHFAQTPSQMARPWEL